MTTLSQYVHQKRGVITALATRVGISQAQMSRVAAGKSRPSTDLARRIEDATAGEVRAAELLGLEESGARFEHLHPPRPLGAGGWGATVAADGSLFLTSDTVMALGFSAGENLVLRPDGEDVRINSSDKSLRKLQAMMKELVEPGVSLADELIAERRAEAARD